MCTESHTADYIILDIKELKLVIVKPKYPCDSSREYMFHNYGGVITGRKFSTLEEKDEPVPRMVVDALKESGYTVKECFEIED